MKGWFNGTEKTVQIIPSAERFIVGLVGPGATLAPVMAAKAMTVQEKVQPIEVMLDLTNVGMWFIWALAFVITWRTPEDSVLKSALTAIGLPGFLVAWIGYGSQLIG